ncbi:MAG: lactate racemase domain-containing protein [Anaerolineae bacterium]
MIIGTGYADRFLNDDEVRDVVLRGFAQADVAGKRVLVIIPDSTRTAPNGQLFRLFHEALWGKVAALDYMIALGTHMPLSDAALNRLLDISAEERATQFAGVRIFNHAWDDPQALIRLGTIPADEVAALTAGLFRQEVAVTINRLVLDYDLLVICGPTFPHEVVGFSGGNKYFFPGISGPEVINFTHWLGAVITNRAIIGTKHTPVRAVIDRAAAMIPRPRLCCAMVVAPAVAAAAEAHGRPPLQGLYFGAPEEAWEAASDLSSRVHIIWVDRPYQRVLSVMPKLYDDIWTGAKGMYKMEPAIADGGEVIIYAPHITEISYTHGHILERIGYHCRDYFLKQWDRFKDLPWGVLAHSTHLRGQGTYDPVTGEEKLRIKVTLATGISRERCERINLGYMDPATIHLDEWKGREDEGILLVPKAGEMLYRVKEK